ncbi:MAG: hypothetical protein ACT6S0_04755 [Roseateles sp.]|uniref:hypothetical protein n=1 Tax=Roseateles sp. TaxID=1971397 RepID=UPI0040352140
MRAPTEPTDAPLVIPARPAPAPVPAPATPDPARHFELGNWGATLPEGLAEKPAAPAPADDLGPPIIF